MHVNVLDKLKLCFKFLKYLLKRLAMGFYYSNQFGTDSSPARALHNAVQFDHIEIGVTLGVKQLQNIRN
jgi:hypothetical protein